MLQIREFQSNFENIYCVCHAIASHDVPTIVAYFHSYDSCETFMSVAQHSYKCRLVLFSRQIVARCSHDFSRVKTVA